MNQLNIFDNSVPDIGSSCIATVLNSRLFSDSFILF